MVDGVHSSKIVLILSGGMDSFTLLKKAVEDGYEPYTLSVHYGQRHSRELRCSRTIGSRLARRHQEVDLSDIQELISNSALTGDQPVPEGHYTEERMRQTVVPNRNMIMLSIASGYALTIGAEEVWFGAHGGDHAIYPDCREIFVDAVQSAVNYGNYEGIRIRAPFLNLDKGSILATGFSYGLAPDDYAVTWTCYQPQGDLACGRCGACRERLEAFAENRVEDPLPYETRDEVPDPS